MTRFFVGAIFVVALVGFALQPTTGRPVPVELSALRGMPLTLGDFTAVSDNSADLVTGPTITDGSDGLDRIYQDKAGRKYHLYVAPQTIGQHVPIQCDRYGGYRIISETQGTLREHPDVRFNELTVQSDADKAMSTCLYYWKTAGGSFVPKPNHSLGMVAVRWSDHQQGLLVNVCTTEDVRSRDMQRSLEQLIDQSYPEVARLYPVVFRAVEKTR